MARLRCSILGWTRLSTKRQGTESVVASRHNPRSARSDPRLVLQPTRIQHTSVRQNAVQGSADAWTHSGPGWREDEQVQGKLRWPGRGHRKAWEGRSSILHSPVNCLGRFPILMECIRDRGAGTTDRLERL